LLSVTVSIEISLVDDCRCARKIMFFLRGFKYMQSFTRQP